MSPIIEITGRHGEEGFEIIEIGGIDGLGGLLESMLGSLLGSRMGPQYLNLASAHNNIDITDYVPEHLLMELVPKQELMKDASITEFQGLIKSMRDAETSQITDINRIMPFDQSTRGTICYLLDSISEQTNKSVALPLPNWHFWSSVAPPTKLEYFDAQNEDQLVEGFQKIARRGNIGTLLLVNPTNPPIYDISEAGAKAIDEIAQKEGVRIVLDEILRGTKAIDERDSIARYFSDPIIVEGFSKRFGDDPFGHMSYIITPQKGLVIPSRELEGNYRAGAIKVIELAQTHASEKVVQEMIARNKAFDQGFYAESKDITIERPFPSSMVSTIKIPKNGSMENSEQRRTRIGREEGIVINDVRDFYPGESNINTPWRCDIQPGQEYFRITVGNIGDQETLYKAGVKISRIVTK